MNIFNIFCRNNSVMVCAARVGVWKKAKAYAINGPSSNLGRSDPNFKSPVWWRRSHPSETLETPCINSSNKNKQTNERATTIIIFSLRTYINKIMKKKIPIPRICLTICARAELTLFIFALLIGYQSMPRDRWHWDTTDVANQGDSGALAGYQGIG